MSVADELSRLAQLRDQGVLSSAEFEKQKKRVLAESAQGQRKKGGCATVALVIIGLVVALAIFGGAGQPDNTAPTGPAQSVTATELAESFQDNEAAAQDRFGDRPVVVTGIVESVQVNLTNDPVVHFRGGVTVHLSDASQPRAATLAKGDTIVVRCGRVRELMGIPIVMDCGIE